MWNFNKNPSLSFWDRNSEKSYKNGYFSGKCSPVSALSMFLWKSFLSLKPCKTFILYLLFCSPNLRSLLSPIPKNTLLGLSIYTLITNQLNVLQTCLLELLWGYFLNLCSCQMTLASDKLTYKLPRTNMSNTEWLSVNWNVKHNLLWII